MMRFSIEWIDERWIEKKRRIFEANAPASNVEFIDASVHFVGLDHHTEIRATMTKSIFERNSSARSSSNNASIQLIRSFHPRLVLFPLVPAMEECFACV